MVKRAHTKNKIFAKGIKRRWILNNLSIVALLLLVGAILIATMMADYYYSDIRSNLANRAQTTANFMNRYMNQSYEDFYVNAQHMTMDFVDKDKLEMQIIDPYGRTMFSSSNMASGLIPATGDVEESFQKKGIAIWSGNNSVLNERVMSVSAPLYYADNQLIGAVRYITSLQLVDRQAAVIFGAICVAAILVFALVIASNMYFIRSIVNPILEINATAKEIAKGNYKVRLNKKTDDEIGELCDTINYMSDEIGREEKMKNDFISSVSHELRTPLTAIGGWSETLLTGSLSLKDTEHGLSIIQSEAKRLSQMVEELLDFSRLESGNFKLQMEVIDARGELSDALFVYADILKKEGMTVKYDEPDFPVMVKADRYRLRQVLLNIIDNAAKYGKDGGRADLTIGIEGSFAVIRVIDYGQGIRPEDLPFVKEKFYKGPSKMRGAGIGLAVCDEIIKLSGGYMDIESELGKGTCVKISLPLIFDET